MTMVPNIFRAFLVVSGTGVYARGLERQLLLILMPRSSHAAPKAPPFSLKGRNPPRLEPLAYDLGSQTFPDDVQSPPER